MYASKLAMDALPNIHLLGVFICSITVVYRKKALWPIYVYVFLLGAFSGGFTAWWVPNLYIWTVLWGAVMLLPKNMPAKIATPVYMCVSALHGFLFGVLYAPFQALMYGLSFEGMLSWIAYGLSYDVTHGISNFCFGILILPFIKMMKTANRISHIS